MTSISDISFLQRPDVSRSIVYRYRSGLFVPRLRHAVDRAIREAAGSGDADGGLGSVEPQGLAVGVMGAGLFEQYVTFCEWPQRRSIALARIADEVVPLLANGDAAKVVIFAPHTSVFFEHPSWPEVPNRALIIEEPLASLETAPEILDYLWSSTDLPFCPIGEARLIAHLFRQIGNSEPMELDEFIVATERALLMDFNHESGTYRSEDDETDDALRSNILRPLRRLLAGDSSAVGALVEGVAIKLRHRAWTADELIAELHRATREICDGPSSKPLAGAETDAVEVFSRSTFLWLVVLINGARRLADAAIRTREKITPEPEAFLAECDSLFRAYVERLSGDAQNPFPDLWEEIDVLLANYSIFQVTRWPSQMERTITVLVSMLQQVREEDYPPVWAIRLKARVEMAALQRARSQQAAIEAD